MIRRTIVALVSVLALALTASAPAHAATPDPTIVKINAAPEPIKAGSTLTIEGTMSYKRSGTWHRAPAGKTLTIRFDPAGPDGSRAVKNVRTNSNGEYRTTWEPTRTGTWIISWARTSTLQAATAGDEVCTYGAGRWECPVSPTNPDVDCSQIGRTVWVGSRDYHRLDADNDGWGCDSYS